MNLKPRHLIEEWVFYPKWIRLVLTVTIIISLLGLFILSLILIRPIIMKIAQQFIELQYILTTFILTIFGGVFIFVLGQIILNSYIKPVMLLKEEIGRITTAIVFYEDLYSNPSVEPHRLKRNAKASKRLRAMASRLVAKANAIPSLAYRFYKIPPFMDILQASHHLIKLSNSLSYGDPIVNDTATKEAIEQLLKIKATSWFFKA